MRRWRTVAEQEAQNAAVTAQATSTLPDRHPFEIYLTLFVFVSSVPAAFGLVPPPSAVAHELAPTSAHAWSILLTVGSFAVLVGILWPRPRHLNMMSVTAVLIEQVGLVILAVGSVLFCPAAISYGGVQTLPIVGLVAGFAVACISLALRIHRILKNRVAQ